MYQIEKATADDAPQITACVQAAYQHYIKTLGVKPGPMLDDYAEMVADHSVWVMRDNGRVIALLVLIDKPEMMLLDNVAVHPDYQGLKLGKRFMAYAEEIGKEREYTAIQLYTHEHMIKNQQIYAKLGYVEFARIHEKGLNRVYMKKPLE